MKTDSRKNISSYITIAFITAGLFSFVCALKSIYPFGSRSMCEGDYKAQVLAVYTHVWDFLHGDSALFFDWCQGLGNNLTGTIWHFSIISPSSLFFLFIPRTFIEQSSFFFITLKLIAISVSCLYVLRKFFPDLPLTMIWGATLLYVFSPYNMEYYLMPGWLDMVFLFPLVLYFLHRLFEEGKCTGYIVTTALFLLLNFQQSYMLAIHLLLCVSVLVLLFGDRYKKRLPAFLCSSILSVLLSSWLVVPGIIQTMTAQRKDSTPGIVDIWSSIWVFHPDKWYKISNVAVPLIFFVVCLVIRVIKSKHVLNAKSGQTPGPGRQITNYIFLTLIIAFMTAPIVLESTNLLWHGGSYESFTMRFAYMTSFWIIIASLYAYKDFLLPATDENRLSLISTILLALFLTTSIFIASKSILVSYDLDHSVLKAANEIYEKRSFSPDIYDRIKVNSGLSSNFNQMSGFGSIQNYTVSQDSEQIDTYAGMGYTKTGYRMDDQGGTVFSDALLGFKKAFTGNSRENQIADLPLTYEPGILLKGENRLEYPYGKDAFEVQNELAQAVIGCDILTKTGPDMIDITAPSRLYCFIPESALIKEVTVEDENTGDTILSRSLDTVWENGLTDLGVYENRVLNVKTDTGEPVACALLDEAVLTEHPPAYADNFSYTMKKSGLDITLNNTKAAEGYDHLFIPVYLSDGIKCKVNGQKVTPVKIAGGISIPVSDGINDISIRFVLPGLIPGIVLSILGIVISAFLLIISAKKKKETCDRAEKLCNILYIALLLISAAIVLVFYVIPVVFFIKCIL